MGEAKNQSVAEVLNELGKKLSQAIKSRDAEISRIDALPAAAKRSGKATYEAVDGTNPKAVEKAKDVNSGMVSKTGIETYVTQKLIRKVEVPKGEGNKEFTEYLRLTKEIRDTIKAMEQAALSRKPAVKARTSSGGSGSHVITKEWFEKHANDCPKAMGVAWDDTNNRITYNLPKGGRGSTTSHGALNNIVKAFGGKSKASSAAAPAAKPAAVVAPAAKKPVPAKKNVTTKP
jgi:hypothetical protein